MYSDNLRPSDSLASPAALSYLSSEHLSGAYTARAVFTRIFAAFIALILIFMCTACSNPLVLPSSGKVTEFSQEKLEQHRIFSNPSGPAQGASPTEIVKGFIDSLPAGIQDNKFSVAKEFLTPEAIKSWAPNMRVLIFQDDPHYARRAQLVGTNASSSYYGTIVSVTMNVTGEIDQAGIYSVAADETITAQQSSGTAVAAQQRQVTFSVHKVNGQWRIAQAPSGVFIPRSDFEQVYRQVGLYEPTPDKKSLLVDNRWFGLGNWRKAAVQALIDGPAYWLDGAVANMDLAGVTVQSVSNLDNANTVHVTLSRQFSQLDEQKRGLFVHMIRLTLGDGDKNAQITVTTQDGESFSQADKDLQISPVLNEQSIYSLSSAGYVLRLEASTFLRVGKINNMSDVSDLVFSPNGGAVLYTLGTVDCITRDARPCAYSWKFKASAITAGPHAEVWAVSADKTSLALLGASSSRGNAPVKIFDFPLHDVRIDKIALSPEGSRLVAAVSGRRYFGLYACGIVRGESGDALDVSDSCLRISSQRDISAVTFFNDSTVVYVAGDGKTHNQQAYSQTAPGLQNRLSLNDSPVTAIAAGQVSSAQKLALRTQSGLVYTVGGSLSGRWTVADTQIAALAHN